jgi:hypothetical protein
MYSCIGVFYTFEVDVIVRNVDSLKQFLNPVVEKKELKTGYIFENVL